jgi:hypothetical protein
MAKLIFETAKILNAGSEFAGCCKSATTYQQSTFTNQPTVSVSDNQPGTGIA